MKLGILKRTMSALALSCISCVSFAHASGGFHGFYAGASAGVSTTLATQVQSAVINFPNGPVSNIFYGPTSLKTDNSFKGALFAGYGQCWNSLLYLGAEVFVDSARYNNENSAENNSVAGIIEETVQMSSHSKLRNVQYGVDLRPGVLLTPQSMLYGRVGVSLSELTLDTDNRFTIRNILVPTPDVFQSLSEEKDVAALRLGAGFEQQLCTCLNIRVDYIYTYYGRIGNGAVTEQVTGNTFVFSTDDKVKVFNNTLMLGLSYQFN